MRYIPPTMATLSYCPTYRNMKQKIIHMNSIKRKQSMFELFILSSIYKNKNPKQKNHKIHAHKAIFQLIPVDNYKNG